MMQTSEGAETIRSATTIDNTSPEEAAQNISRANLLGVDPDTYKSNKDNLEPEAVSLERVPAQVMPETEKFARTDQTRLALMKEDIDKMNAFERRVKYHEEKILTTPTRNREINEIIARQMDAPGGILEAGDQEMLNALQEEESLAQQSLQFYGIGEGEELASDVVSAAGDMIRSYWDNKEIVGGLVGGGAVVGAGVGSVVPGIGTIAGLTTGAAKGVVGAMTVVGAIDGYQQTSRSLYRSLSNATDNQGNPIEVPHDRRVNVSQGVGLLAGVAGAAAGKFLASGNSFLKKFIDPSKAASYITKESPAMLARMDILGGIAKSIMSEGTEEGFQEFIQIAGENFGKMDESESSFVNALEQTITDYETWRQTGRATVVGGLTGGLIQSVTSAPGYQKLKGEHERIQTVSNEKKAVLETQNMMLEASKDMEESKIGKFAPEEMKTWQKAVFRGMGIDDKVWFHLEDLREFANTPERSEAIRKIIDPTGEITRMSQELNTPLPISKADLMSVIKDHPEITDIMRTTPDGESPTQIRNEGKDFASRLEAAEGKRQELINQLGLEEATPEQQEQLRRDIQSTLGDTKYFDSRESFLGQAALTPVEGILNDTQAAELSTAQIEARLEIDQAIVGPVDRRFERYAEAEFNTETNEMIAQEIGKLQKEYEVIERFTNTKNLSDLDSDFTKSHSRKGFSALAIDPATLSEAQRAIYSETTDPNIAKNIKSRKTFVKGGLHIEEAALLAGVENGDALLKILAETPTKKQIENRVKNDPLRNETRPDQIAESHEGTRDVARDEAFTKLTRSHLKEMEIMAANNWNTVKRGMIKIAKRVPTIKALNERAKLAIGSMKIGDIDPRMYERGEKKSHQDAIKQYADGQIEQAFDSKEKAALNNEMRKEAVKARAKVERFQNFWSRVSTPSNMQALKDANMDKVMNEYMSVYKLDGDLRGATEQKSFNAWVKRQTDEGRPVPFIPDRLDETRSSYKDLTLEQYQAITEMGQYILEQAKLKNKILKKQADQAAFETQETRAEMIRETAEANHNFNLDRVAETNSRHLNAAETALNIVGTIEASLASVKSVVLEFDGHKLDGVGHRLISKPLKDAETTKRSRMVELEARDKAAIEKYGLDKLRDAFVDVKIVPEFDGIVDLGDGKGAIRKTDLMTLQAYMGDPGGLESIGNWKRKDGTPLTVEQVRAVLDTHLDETDADFVQEFLVDRWEPFKQEVFELNRRTTGQEIEMIEGVETIHRGKVRKGGYYPNQRQMEPIPNRVRRWVDRIKEGSEKMGIAEEGPFYAKMRGSEMTQQGRSKERTGSARPMDLNFNNFIQFSEEVIHDLAYRETGIDVLTTLKNPENVQNISAAVGTKKFVALLNGVKDTVSKATDREGMVLFGDANSFFSRVYNQLHTGHAVSAIGLNPISALIQPVSLGNVVLRSPKTTKYLFSQSYKIIKAIATDPRIYQAYVDQAAQVNPDIKFEKDGIDHEVTARSYEFVPNVKMLSKNKKTGKRFETIKRIIRTGADMSFKMTQTVDQGMKVLTTNAVTEQFLNGDLPGYPKDKVDSMSDAERGKVLRSHVQQLIDTSLTASSRADKSALEKIEITKIFTRYFTDVRSTTNTALAQVDKIKGSVRKGNYKQAGTQTALFMLVTGAMAAYIKEVRDDEESFSNKAAEGDYADLAKATAWGFIKAPVDQVLDGIPMLNAVRYSSDMKTIGDYKTVSTPLFKTLSDLSTSLAFLNDALDMAISEGELPTVTDKQRKNLLTSAGYLIGGAPTNMMNKGIDYIQDTDFYNSLPSPTEAIKNTILETHQKIDEYIEKYKDKPEAQDFIEELKDYKKELPQFDSDVKNILPENAKEDMKAALSGGKWDKFNPETGAVGSYQFTEDRWKEIANRNPDLGLTENGRVAKDQSQQEKAMDWEIADNSRALLAYELPVTTANLLGAHEFGQDTFIGIAISDDSDKLSDAIGEDAKRPDLARFKTVGEVRKYLSNKL